MAINCHSDLSLCYTPFPFLLLDYAMNQPDVLSQIQPEGEHNTDDHAGPEESEIPTDPSEGKGEERSATPCLPVYLSPRFYLVRDDGSGLKKQAWWLLEPLSATTTRLTGSVRE